MSHGLMDPANRMRPLLAIAVPSSASPLRTGEVAGAVRISKGPMKSEPRPVIEKLATGSVPEPPVFT